MKLFCAFGHIPAKTTIRFVIHDLVVFFDPQRLQYCSEREMIHKRRIYDILVFSSSDARRYF
jgi:hypothetical protein